MNLLLLANSRVLPCRPAEFIPLSICLLVLSFGLTAAVIVLDKEVALLLPELAHSTSTIQAMCMPVL